MLAVGVVDDEDIGPFTGNGTPNTDSEIVALLVGIPTSSRLGVRRQYKVRKYRFVSVGIDQVTDFTTETDCKLGGVGALDDFFVRELPQKPSRQQIRGKLRLSVARRHINNKPLALAPSHPLKRIRHFRMVPTPNERRPDFLNKLKEPLLTDLAALHLGQLVELSQQ